MKTRIGMIVPSLNTIAEDDFRRFCPQNIGFYVHRVRLRDAPGPVTVADLAIAFDVAPHAARLLGDLNPQAILFNCTGASVAPGPDADGALAAQMTEQLGVPATNAMHEIKHALRALGARHIVHVCPFAGDSANIERLSLIADGFKICVSKALGFKDARDAAQLSPEAICAIASQHDVAKSDVLLLSCANIRAYEALPLLETKLKKPIVTTNQAALWGTLRLAGYHEPVAGAGCLASLQRPA